jgi:hypothetical protein
MDQTSRAAYDLVRSSWIDLIRQHGWSEIYNRAELDRARSHWRQFTDGDDWVEAGITAHRAHWDGSCNRPTCQLHGETEPAAAEDEGDGDWGAPGPLSLGDSYRPETDPVKIRVQEENLARLRARMRGLHEEQATWTP